MTRPRFQRILLKLSGEVLMGSGQFGIDPDTVTRVAEEILAVREAGHELCIVVGGGNIFRGVAGAAQGFDRATGDYMGMLATVMNALAVQNALERLGVDTGATHLVDVSGLGTGSVIPARVLVDVLRLATSADHPELRPLLADLPVAGFSGTLSGRYLTGAAHAAAGLLRAKTGTLTGVSTLAGMVVDEDGRLLLFAVMADRVPRTGTLDARQAVDRVGATLVGCGCR